MNQSYVKIALFEGKILNISNMNKIFGVGSKQTKFIDKNSVLFENQAAVCSN